MTSPRPAVRIVAALASLWTGAAAGSCLFVSTLWAAGRPADNLSPEITVGLAAAVQAAGVFIGSFLVARLGRRMPSGRVVAAGLIMAAALCAQMIILPPGLWAFLCLAGAGIAIGLGVAAIDGLAAAWAPDRPTSAVLKIALAGSVGAMLAPVLVQIAKDAGISTLVVPIASFLVAGALWTALRTPAAQTPSPRGPRWGLLVLPAFLFGVVDNGILALAPAQASVDGAATWTVAWLGFTAAAGAALVQLVAVLRAETAPGRGRVAHQLMVGCLVGLAGALALLALRPEPMMAGMLLTLIGLLADIAYGLGLFAYLRTVPAGTVAGATAAYVCACALGETVGPVLLSGLGHLAGPSAAPLAAAALATACLVAGMRRRSRIARPLGTPA